MHSVPLRWVVLFARGSGLSPQPLSVPQTELHPWPSVRGLRDAVPSPGEGTTAENKRGVMPSSFSYLLVVSIFSSATANFHTDSPPYRRFRYVHDSKRSGWSSWFGSCPWRRRRRRRSNYSCMNFLLARLHRPTDEIETRADRTDRKDPAFEDDNWSEADTAR